MTRHLSILVALLVVLLGATPASAQFSGFPGARPHMLRQRGGYAILLQSVITTPAQAYVVFGPQVISSRFDEYQIEYVNALPTTDGQSLCIQVSKDGGTTWEATNYKWAQLNYTSANAGRYNFSNSTICLIIQDAVRNNTSYGFNGSTWLTRQVGKVATARTQSITLLNDNNLWGGFSRTWWQDASTWNAIRVYYNADSFASGTIRIYGVISR